MGLEILAPTPVDVTVRGRALSILPVRIRDGEAFGRAVDKDGDIVEVIVIGARVERAWVEDLTQAEVNDLAGIVLRVNADFFAERTSPATDRLVETMRHVRGRLTPSPTSPSSSETTTTL